MKYEIGQYLYKSEYPYTVVKIVEFIDDWQLVGIILENVRTKETYYRTTTYINEKYKPLNKKVTKLLYDKV